MRALRILLIPLVPVVVVGWLVAAIGYELHPLFVMGCIPILVTFALVAANALSAVGGREGESLIQAYPRTTWRLIDPHLSTWGIWRAELGPHPPVNSQSGDNDPGEEYVRSLIRDWSFRGGWPFYGLSLHDRSLRITRVDPSTVGPEPFESDGQTIYQVIWKVREGDGEAARTVRYRGWLRLGRDDAEFQLETDGRGRVMPPMSDEEERAIAQDFRKSDQAEIVADSEPVQAFSDQHPLWDQWLDG